MTSASVSFTGTCTVSGTGNTFPCSGSLAPSPQEFMPQIQLGNTFNTGYTSVSPFTNTPGFTSINPFTQTYPSVSPFITTSGFTSTVGVPTLTSSNVSSIDQSLLLNQADNIMSRNAVTGLGTLQAFSNMRVPTLTNDTGLTFQFANS